MKSFEKNKNKNTNIEINSIEEESRIQLDINTNSKSDTANEIKISEVLDDNKTIDEINSVNEEALSINSNEEGNHAEIKNTDHAEIENTQAKITVTSESIESDNNKNIYSVDKQLNDLAKTIASEGAIKEDHKPLNKKINTFSKDTTENKEVTKNTDNKSNIVVYNTKSDKNFKQIKTDKNKSNKNITKNKFIKIKTKSSNTVNNKTSDMTKNNKTIENLKNLLPEYELPRMVSISLFLIGLMIIVCITLIVSINNRNVKYVDSGVSMKTYISPIFEGQKDDKLNSYSYEQNPFSLPYIIDANSNGTSDNQSLLNNNSILNEINALQNVENVESNLADEASIEKQELNSDNSYVDLKHDQNIERLDYLLKSYVIISPSVDPSVNQLFTEYFDARMNVDLEKYLGLFGYDMNNLNVDSFGSLRRSLEYERSLISMITNVKIYICAGFDTNEKICFVNYDMLLRYANAIIPSVFYANIVLIGDRYYIQPQLDTFRQIYVDHIIKQEEIRSLNYNVKTRLNNVLESNDFARIVYVSLRDKQFKIEDLNINNNDELNSYTIQNEGGVFSTAEPVNKVVLNDLRSQISYDNIPSYHGLLTDPLLK